MTPEQIAAVAGKRCTICETDEFLQDGHGKGGLNDVCKPCFYLWYDGVAPRVNEKGFYRVFGVDILAASIAAFQAGKYPWSSAEFVGAKGPPAVRDYLEKETRL